ncbi:MAG: hypothetical protein PUE12_02930 [Oscillospiraceae bacterium]|nr:hypothetical protein [Oscillospiraceae bacterium]
MIKNTNCTRIINCAEESFIKRLEAFALIDDIYDDRIQGLLIAVNV